MKFYKGLLKFIQIAVILVVLPRVADFVGQLGPQEAGFDIHDLIRVAFALTLGLGTIATAYFANDAPRPTYDDEPPNPKERKRREREATYFATMLNAAPAARKAVVLFAVLDGTFNLADAVRGASMNGLFDVGNHAPWLVVVYTIATILFGISPTVLALMLAYVISLVDRIPLDYEQAPTNRKKIDWVRTILGNLGVREYRAGDVPELPSEIGVRPTNSEQRSLRLPGQPTGEQRQRILDFLDTHATADNMPSVRTIQEMMEEPKPSISTISVVRREWINGYDPFKRGPHGDTD